MPYPQPNGTNRTPQLASALGDILSIVRLLWCSVTLFHYGDFLKVIGAVFFARSAASTFSFP